MQQGLGSVGNKQQTCEDLPAEHVFVFLCSCSVHFSRLCHPGDSVLSWIADQFEKRNERERCAHIDAGRGSKGRDQLTFLRWRKSWTNTESLKPRSRRAAIDILSMCAGSMCTSQRVTSHKLFRCLRRKNVVWTYRCLWTPRYCSNRKR